MGYSSKIPVKSMWYSNSDLVGELVSLRRNMRPDARAGAAHSKCPVNDVVDPFSPCGTVLALFLHSIPAD
jgi:hypothetical protein